MIRTITITIIIDFFEIISYNFSVDQTLGRRNSVLNDEQFETVLMVGYGYHREWDYLNQRSRWSKGFLSGAPTNPLNDEPEQSNDDDEGL